MKTLIIGGGMAGLTYGILAAEHQQVTLCERNARVGKKLSATGNGRCNLGNVNANEHAYNKSEIVNRVLHAVNVERYVEFLHNCGIYVFADNAGRLYPLSESAANVVDCLRREFSVRGGKTLCDCEVTAVTSPNGGYLVHFGEKTEFFNKVVLACGSNSGVTKPCVCNLVPERYFTPLVPSLVPIKTVETDKILNGLRAKASVSLCEDGKLVATESGEVQFRDFGISGICVFNLSAHIARKQVLGETHDYVFAVDLVPQLDEHELEIILCGRKSWEKETLFYGLLHNKLAQYVLKRTPSLSPQNLAKTAKNLTFQFKKLSDFASSQVTAGGIDEKFVDLNTLSLPNGMIALGEILSVDGICGGYNLYFAAASAIYAWEREANNG